MNQKSFIFLFLSLLVLSIAACTEKAPAIPEDFSSPQATFKTLQAGIAAWDTNVIWHCMREGDFQAQNKHQFVQALIKQRKTLQECFKVTEMSNVLVDEPDYKAYMLRNCRNIHDSNIEFGITGSGWKVAHLLEQANAQFPKGNP